MGNNADIMKCSISVTFILRIYFHLRYMWTLPLNWETPSFSVKCLNIFPKIMGIFHKIKKSPSFWCLNFPSLSIVIFEIFLFWKEIHPPLEHWKKGSLVCNRLTLLIIYIIPINPLLLKVMICDIVMVFSEN